MNFRPRPREQAEVNLTPLIDVVFLLLIFFMVSASFDRHSSLEVTLPEAEAMPPEDVGPARLTIEISANGTYRVNDRVIPVLSNSASPDVVTVVETLKQALRSAARGRSNLPVTIQADAEARHQAVVNAMEAANQLGLRRVSIATIVPRRAPSTQ